MRAIRPDLLDVNVWVALSHADHVHHARARRYWETESAESVGFCRLTMLAFIRLITNRKVMDGRHLLPSEAWDLYHEFRNEPRVDLLTEPHGLEQQMTKWSNDAAFPVRLWTDCALAAWAHAANCRLVSFDVDYQRFEGLQFLHLMA